MGYGKALAIIIRMLVLLVMVAFGKSKDDTVDKLLKDALGTALEKDAIMTDLVTKIVNDILDELFNHDGGFAWWWHEIGKDGQSEIEEELSRIVTKHPESYLDLV